MASSSSSSSPSSSAVTLPRPGKSILKRPPPPQQSFFSLSRLSRLLPTQATPAPSTSSSSTASSNTPNEENLKRAHFILPHLTVIYPFSAATPPCGPNVKEEKRAADSREAERRKRIVRGNSYGPGNETDDWWDTDKVESFYRECCEGREEVPHPSISAALKRAKGATGRSLDLSGVQLTPSQAATLSDVFSVEWGLRKLVLKECDLDDRILKPLLHALLIPGSLSFLSVASNRRLKAPAFRVIGAFMHKMKSLQFLDVSQNFLDKKSVEYIGASLSPANESGLVSLKLDDCSLRPAALESLAQAVRTSSLRNISLRHNRISASGAVALALMIKDYPDAMPSYSASSASPSSSASSPTSSLFSTLSPPATPTTTSPPLTPTRQSIPLPVSPGGVIPPPQRHAPHPHPPPIHPASAGASMKTTYTPYVPRSRRGPPVAAGAGLASATAKAVQNATLQPNPPHVPLITSSAQGGVTTRHAVPPSPLSATMNVSGITNTSVSPIGLGARTNIDQGPSVALLDKVRALDALPRLGELRTLDLRGNDIKNGITYVAQVLKRNRTLKVLNLCENKIDVAGLVSIAEALKYNLTLETLDLSKNPCSGPALQGIQSLRTAFTLNSSLKRLFLSSTQMGSAGAIALAEFLPESASLLHLDLTSNNLELAGVMALSGSLKANHAMRCLDLNIPPDDDEYARMCRDILNTCIRNTEEAERSTSSSSAASGRGHAKGVWGLIEESELAKRLKTDDASVKTEEDEDIVSKARTCEVQLKELVLARTLLLPSPTSPHMNGHAPRTPAIDEEDLRNHATSALEGLSDVIQAAEDPSYIEELFSLNDSITSLLTQLSELTESGKSGNSPGNGHITVADRKPSTITPNGGLMLLIPGSNGQPTGTVTREGDEEDEEDDSVTTPETPKINKGKGRAEPIVEKVLSPSFVLSDEDEDEESERRAAFVSDEPENMLVGPSPTDLSKVWVEEEGEVFRKGNALLGPEEMEGEIDSEELRMELLEAEVERPPPRSLSIDDDFAADLPPLPMSPAVEINENGQPQASTTSPDVLRPYLRRSRSSSSSLQGGSASEHDATKSPLSPLDAASNPSTPLSPALTQSPISPGPVPYLPRRRSSSSTITSAGP